MVSDKKAMDYERLSKEIVDKLDWTPDSTKYFERIWKSNETMQSSSCTEAEMEEAMDWWVTAIDEMLN